MSERALPSRNSNSAGPGPSSRRRSRSPRDRSRSRSPPRARAQDLRRPRERDGAQARSLPRTRRPDHERDDRKRHRRPDSSPDNRDDEPKPDRRNRDGERDRRAHERPESRSRRRRSEGSGGRRRPVSADSNEERHPTRSTEPSTRRYADDPRLSDRHGQSRGSHHPPVFQRGEPLPSQQDTFALLTRPAGRVGNPRGERERAPAEKEVANYRTTGRLAAASNSVARPDGSSIVLKYHEPPEARKPPPKAIWRLVIFKEAPDGAQATSSGGQASQDGDVVASIDLGTRSCWLVGRETTVADIAGAHPSLSAQHAVIQFRHVESAQGGPGRVRPYLIDLESSNGTLLNGTTVPESRYVEIRHGDLIQFGHSSREYVLVRSQADADAQA